MSLGPPSVTGEMEGGRRSAAGRGTWDCPRQELENQSSMQTVSVYINTSVLVRTGG